MESAAPTWLCVSATEHSYCPAAKFNMYLLLAVRGVIRSQTTVNNCLARYNRFHACALVASD